MVFFHENQTYWGNLTRPQIEIGNGRLSARSVKMFADGPYNIYFIFKAKDILIKWV